jgi:hypothetical protein
MSLTKNHKGTPDMVKRPRKMKANGMIVVERRRVVVRAKTLARRKKSRRTRERRGEGRGIERHCGIVGSGRQ